MSARLTTLVLVVAFSGCTHGPGYFPHLFPPGSIDQYHAKPGGRGYFRDFDPKAQRLVIRPDGFVNAPLGSQIVLVASVVDKDGTARRDRRVEWIVEGPGNIVEADESGSTAGRGYLLDNKRAVTHTRYLPATITRGNDDPKDDVALEPGQTFIVLSSAVPGETVVTAYAPAVFNWDNGRVITKVMWGDARFRFPEAVTARVGGEAPLTTSVNPTASDAGTNFRVRYRVIEGPPAVLVTKGSDDTIAALSGSGGKEAEAFTDTNGEAAVRLVQRDPKQGKTRVAVEIVKPPESGVGPGVVVGRRETTIEWANPELKLKITAPPVAAAAGTFPVQIALDNVAGVDSKDAQVRVTLSDGATLARSEPPPVRRDEKGTLVFNLPPVGSRGKQQVTLQVKPAKVGTVTVGAEAVTADGLQASTSEAVRVEQGRLQLLVEAPPFVLSGERIPAKVSVTNAGAAPAEGVTVWARFDDGLTAAQGRSPVELAVGALVPGQTKTLELPLGAKATGRYGLRATATGDGGLSAAAEPVSIEVRRTELQASVTGPKLAYLGQQVTLTVNVANKGDAQLTNAVARATIPPELKVTAADGGSVGAGSIEWKIADLAPGGQKSFQIEADALKLAPQAGVTVSVQADAVSNGKTVGAPVEASAEGMVAIIGTPALVLELATPPGVVEVGKRARFLIRVKNQGTVAARNVDVSAAAPGEFKVLRGSGPSDGRADGRGGLTFPTVDELAPGQSLVFTIEVEAVQAGDARVTATVKAAHLTNPLREEQSTRVNGR